MNSSFSEFEKKSDEITATGGHRILSPVDVNDVLYRLSHATTISYLWPTSPVGHLEQFVLTTEPRDHEIACEGTGKSCPCGRAEHPEAGRTSAEPIHSSVFRILRGNV